MKNRPLTFKPELEEIIRKCDACALGMVDSGSKPYVINMNFGYHDNCFYFHSSKQGKKIDILRENPDVCITFSTDHDLKYVNQEVACSWAMRYRSVLAYGKVVFVDDYQEKEEALKIIMSQYTDSEFSFTRPAVLDVMVFKVVIEKLEGRAYGY